MVDPVVRAKLADWLYVRLGDFGTYADETPSARENDADSLADSLLGLPPSVRAQLLGLGMEREWAIFAVWDDGSTGAGFDDFAEAEAYAAKASTWGSGPVTTLQRERLVTPWLPVDPPPVGVAGRNQPNPNAEEAK